MKMSVPCLKTELDLFSPSTYQSSILESQHVEYLPLSTLTDAGPYEFFISSSSIDYLDPSDLYLHVRFKIVKADGTVYDPTGNVAPECNLLHNLFSTVSLSLNDTEVTLSSLTYPYRAFLTNLLSYSRQTEQGHLATQFWIRDDPTKVNVSANDNLGYRRRKDLTALSREVELYGRLQLDICEQPKLLLPGVSLKIKLTRSSDAFALRGHDNAKIHLTHISLFLRKVKVNPSIHAAHLNALNKTNARYPIQRKMVKMFMFLHKNDQLFFNKMKNVKSVNETDQF